VLLRGEEHGGRLVRQAGDGLLAYACQKRREVPGVALPRPSSETRARQEALQCSVEAGWRRDDVQRSGH
jgi:class 3 adenylate cyclase